MRMNTLKAILKTATRGAAVLLCGAGFAAAQQQVSLTAGRTNTTLPDGSLVPMWGYSCGTAVTGSTATCAALNPNAGTAAVITPATPGWSPVVITVPVGQPLQINLTNALSVPTSLTIVGQLGGGLGAPVAGAAISHSQQGATWPIAGPPGGGRPTFTPPVQGPRVQSFGTEANANGGTATLTWSSLTPGTYLIESGTHPSIQGPMGLYGILVVTAVPTTGVQGCAYPGAATACAVPYDAEVPLLLSEIDKVQNTSVDTAVATTGFSENTVWTGGPTGCGAAHTCYPPTVNYSPLYYLINGVAFNKSTPTGSLFPTSPATGIAGTTGKVLVRMVNAGLRMHVPSIVGAQTGATPVVGGFSLIAEDGNLLPGIPRVQSEVFMAAGKTYDVMVNAPATVTTALPVYDRQLSLSGNAISRDGGMLAYIGVNGAGIPTVAGIGIPPVAVADNYPSLGAGQPLAVLDPSKGVIANDSGVYGVTLLTQATNGTVGLNSDGTFTYTPNTGSTATSDTFSYCANGTVIPPAAGPCSSGISATVTLAASALNATSVITCGNGAFTATTASTLATHTPGVLANCTDPAKLKITADSTSFHVTAGSGTISGDVNGGFVATSGGAGSLSFSFTATNSLGKTATGNATVTFPAGSGLVVKVLDGADHTTTISDYRWIIEEDRTFYVDPICAKAQGQSVPAGCPTPSATSPVINFGTNFHTSFMPLVATGCTGPESCADSQTVGTVTVAPKARTYPGDVALDPTKRYYISVLPGDAAQPFIHGYTRAPDCSAAGVAAGSCGHGMGGAPIPILPTGGHTSQAVTIITEPSPYPPATLSAFVFEDDYPLNGEHDAGGQLVDTSAAGNEPGLGGFQVTIVDNAGGTGDSTGTPTYDMFNMPLSNALSGTIDPSTGNDACPISTNDTATGNGGVAGMVVTCPTFESDGTTFSPLAGQVIIRNLYAGRYGVIANPGADRIAVGEEWVQTNTLDGQKAHDSFMRIGEPGYFQEFGPAGYHVNIGFANPKIINDRLKTICAAANADCTHEVTGHVTTARMSRTPDERLYGSGTHDAYAFTQCYISLGDPDGADFAFTKCDDSGTFDFKGLPAGNWKITTFDQWNDQVVDGITTAVGMCDPAWNSFSTSAPTGCIPKVDLGEVGVHQWQANIYTRTFLDFNGDGLSNKDANGNDTEPGLVFAATNIRFRDGSFSNFNNTDLNGYAGFNEVFPLFNWYVVETDSTRYKNTGTHVVYDSGGPADNTQPGGAACYPTGTLSKTCGNSSIAANLANTYEPNPVPPALSVPGAVYCTVTDTADCNNESIATGAKRSVAAAGGTSTMSTGRIDPPWVDAYGWQGFSGQAGFLEFGKRPFAAGENGGIHGHVVYASTRPFDDPQLLLQTSWEPLVPHVRINLYQEALAADGVTTTQVLVDHTDTTSFDDWAQGFRTDGVPNMNCPGQGNNSSEAADPYFFFTLQNQPQFLNVYNSQHGGPAVTPLPNNAQFKCYDGMHNWNQLQPAVYDGMFKFPSVTGTNTVTGNTTGTNCTICVKNPDPTDAFRFGKENMLPAGKYIVEVVVPPGYELVKEEDKNILIGDNFIAPATQQFGGLGSVFILPDQAEVNAYYNPNNAQNNTVNLGRNPNLPSHEGDTGSIESYWPCVGALRVVPDFISLFPDSAEVAPFAGASRNLCDRKEVTLTDQTAVLTKFYIFTETHAAAHFTGQITDDFAAEFDPFSPAFGEKFAPAYLPVALKDWAGNEINRVYADQWGAYNGLNYSTWEVNPPNPTGYGPTMMVSCMNDAGPVVDTTPGSPTLGQSITDPLYQSGYSDFCYELPFMPGQTGYFDTPVVPTSAFAGDYNTPDCAYPDATPAIKEVDGDGIGPWVGGAKGTVIAVNVTAGGAGYTGTPTVVFTGGGGTGVAGTAVTAGSVNAVSLTNGGRGYTGTPAITLTGGGGSGATATVTSMTGSVTSVTMGTTGVYSRLAPVPTVTFSAVGAGCTRATGTANMFVLTATTRRLNSVTITNPGTCYVSPATVTFSAATGIGAVTATGTVNLGQSVLSIALSSGGSGYSSAPTLAFDASPAGNTARATGSATDSSSVVAVNLSNSGSGYTSAPTISFTGGGGSNAAATAALETGGTLTITALGDQNVDNYAYSGPSATLAPFNQQTVKRHYGFGATAGTVKIGNVTVAPANVSWSDTVITVTVPSGVTACPITQQAQFHGSAAQCGELVITAANGKQSIDTVTVTIGGKAPTHIAASDTIQSKIDAAQPGDLLIVDPTCTQTVAGVSSAVSCSAAPAAGATIAKTHASHLEMVLMWKPVRLQGVGAASSIIDGNPHPAGRLDPWHREVVCLFGLALNGTPISGSNVYDPSSTFTCSQDMQFSVDRLPLEATVGWDATLNGNLAEQLIEPTIMGAYEGAGITVLGKGVKFPGGSNPFASDVFPTGTLVLKNSDCGPNTASAKNPFPSNFLCNPSSIDGLTVKNSSQGGGGILVHGWAHDLQIANNRVVNNQGTLSGGITIGQGEHPDAYLAASIANTVPGSCIADGNAPVNMALPFCFDLDVNIHNNYVSQNSSLGDELFSSTPAGAGGVTFCSGSDYYKFNFNWICGNMSTGDGAGVAHLGYSYDGDIEHNTILFNQSTNPTITTNGGGLLIMGAPDQDPVCPVPQDTDCVVDPATIAPSDGVGPGLLINANLIVGNAADAGSGGGLRLQNLNGTEVLSFPNGAPTGTVRWQNVGTHTTPSFQTSTPWNAVRITNNIIANNVAGWDGGGVSMVDALATDFINNTVVYNNSTASSGVLLQTLFAPLASTTPMKNCTINNGTNSCPQVAGLVSVTNSAVLNANIALITPGGTTAIKCPAGHGTRGTSSDCTKYSVPALDNDIFWQNRATMIAVGGLSTGPSNPPNTNQNSQVSMYNAPFGPGGAVAAASQNVTGACNDGNASYWDIGIRGDKVPSGTIAAGTAVGLLTPTYSILTQAPAAGGGSNNFIADPQLTSKYCNGARVPLEAVTSGAVLFATGWQVPPGTNESNALPAPAFTLSPSATVDEGNNWINLRWGPLSLNYPGANVNAVLPSGSPANNKVASVNALPAGATNPYTMAPSDDFFGNPRKQPGNPVDIGAVEYFVPANTPLASVSPTSLTFTNVAVGTTSAPQTLTVSSSGTANVTGITVAVTAPFARSGGTCATATPLAPGQTCTILATFTPASTTAATGTVTVTSNVAVTGSPVSLSGTGVTAVKTATFTPTTWTLAHARNCPGTGVVGILACTLDPAQAFTLTNTGNVNLTGVTAGSIGGTAPNPANYTIVGLLSNCGNATHQTLAPGATCTITVQFKPLTAQAAGPKSATISVTDSVGTQTSTLSGTAQ